MKERKSRSAFFGTCLLLVAFSVGAFIFRTPSPTPNRNPPAPMTRDSSAPIQRTTRQPSDERKLTIKHSALVQADRLRCSMHTPTPLGRVISEWIVRQRIRSMRVA